MRYFIPTLVCVAVFSTGGSVEAALIGVFGDVAQIAAPPNVELDQWTSNTEASIFVEQTNCTLPIGIEVNLSVPGVTPGGVDHSRITLPAGTGVDSYYLQFDPIGVAANEIEVVGTVTFDRDVIGVIYGSTVLHLSNFMGAPGTTYPGNESWLGLKSEDSFSLSADRRSITFQFLTRPWIDSMRIVTEGNSAVPEPSTYVLGAIGLLGLTLYCRRRQTRKN